MQKKLGEIIRHNLGQLMFVVLSFALMVVVSYLFVSRIVEKEIFSNVLKTMQTEEVDIRADFQEAEVALLTTELFAKEMLRKGGSMEELRSYIASQTNILTPQRGRVRGFMDIYAYIRGEFISGTGWEFPREKYNPFVRPWYVYAAEADGNLAITSPYIDADTGKTIITFTKMMKIEGEEKPGVIALDIDFSLISDFVLSLQFAEGGYGMLIDENYTFIVHPNKEILHRQLGDISPYHARIADDFRDNEENVATARMPNSQGIPVVLVFMRLFNGWSLGIATPVASYYQDVYSMATVLSLIGFACMSILAIFLIRLSAARERANEESKEKSSFLARMSHEIRTPMNSILGMAELIQRKAVVSEVKEYVEIILQSGQTLLAIINDILDFSKIESGRLKIEKRSYHIASVINDMVNVIRPRAAEKSLDFFVSVDPEIPAEMLGDDVRLRQILMNLLTNAVKYTKKGFISLNVTTEKIDGRSLKLVCAVEDSGIGIKAEDIKRLFVEFSRVDIAANQGIEGTGLGLIIARALCRAMGGDIIVESEYGNGSVFRAAVAQEFESDIPVARIADPDKKRILFYDWRPKHLNHVCGTFKKLGIVNTNCLSDFREFLDALENGDYDYAFISSRYAMECISVLGKRNAPSQLIIIVESGETAIYREVSSVLMPVYSVTVARALNEDDIPVRGAKIKTRLTAPRAKILIVDDISTNLMVAKELMAPYNMNIRICLSGEEAIECVKNDSYDIVFMDHMMPGMDGIEAAAHIRALDAGDGLYKNLPIIALTANAVAGQREKFLEHGINDFLAKPIDVQKLDEILAKWIPPEKQNEGERRQTENGGGRSSGGSEKDAPPAIDGIDTDAGLRNTGGSRAAYLDILSDFCRDAESRADRIKDALDSGDIKLYVTLVHALKGAARAVGATDIGDAAERLEESAGAEKNDALIRNKTEELAEKLRTLCANIKTVVRNTRDNEKTIAPAALHLEILKAALADMNISKVNKMLLEYAGMRLDSETRGMISEIEELILMFEYDKAIQKINGLV
jgi:signal transduction histidine kinase